MVGATHGLLAELWLIGVIVQAVSFNVFRRAFVGQTLIVDGPQLISGPDHAPPTTAPQPCGTVGFPVLPMP